MAKHGDLETEEAEDRGEDRGFSFALFVTFNIETEERKKYTGLAEGTAGECKTAALMP